jgi:hypothetical protein
VVEQHPDGFALVVQRQGRGLGDVGVGMRHGSALR